ncbi:unnamed protein product [Sphagnum balticum]
MCVNCANGYIRTNGTCALGVKYCQQYGTAGECNQCDPDYSLVLNECKHNYLLGCKNEQPDHTCQECYHPFELQNYHCLIPNCKALNDFGCVSCECGFYLTQIRGCQKLPDGCLKSSRGVCVECLPHYKLKGGSCVIEGCSDYEDEGCKSCSEDYDLVDGTCQFRNCFDWHQDQCLICLQGFNLVAGKCVQADAPYICSG